MAETSRSRSSRTTKDTATADDLKGDLPERYAEAEEKGYFGTTPDANPNSAYSLEGGPPTASNAELVASGDKVAAGEDATDTDETTDDDGNK